jgi:hypothetical protein
MLTVPNNVDTIPNSKKQDDLSILVLLSDSSALNV